MAKKAPQPEFELYLKGVYPEDVSARDLAEVVESLQAVLGLYAPRGGSEASVRVLTIKRGSARYGCAAAGITEPIDRFRRFDKDVNQPSPSATLASALLPLEELSRVAKRLRCDIVVRHPDSRDVLASIGPETYGNIARVTLNSGPVQVSATVERVGGATRPKCVLRLAHQDRLVFCELDSRDLAKKIGQFVYQDIVATGTAKWIRHTHEIVALRVKAVNVAPRSQLDQAFRSLRLAGGSAWDGIQDPASFLRESTGG